MVSTRKVPASPSGTLAVMTVYVAVPELSCTVTSPTGTLADEPPDSGCLMVPFTTAAEGCIATSMPYEETVAPSDPGVIWPDASSETDKVCDARSGRLNVTV